MDDLPPEWDDEVRSVLFDTDEEAETTEDSEAIPPPLGPPIPDDLVKNAIKKFRSVLKGNGIRSTDADLVPDSLQGAVIEFFASQHFRIKIKTSDKILPGKENGEVIASEEELRKAVQRATASAAQNSSVVDDTKKMLNKREDKGFFIDRQALKFQKLNRIFVVHVPCVACDSGKIHCRACRGNGKEPCPKCKGGRDIGCPECHGTQYVPGPQGKRVQCMRCHGRGRIGCELCREAGVMQCRKCGASGRVACNDCAGTGCTSKVTTLQMEAHSQFEYDRNSLPEDVALHIDKLKSKLISQGHAKSEFISQEEFFRQRQIKQQERYDRGEIEYSEVAIQPPPLPTDEYVVHYLIKLPIADLTFAYKKTQVSGKLFGYRPEFLNMPPFLEDLIKHGEKALHQAAENPLETQEHLKKALRYRIIGEAIISSERYSDKKALASLMARYPFGLPAATAESLIKSASKALQNLTRKPRLIALGVGAACSAIISILYFFGTIRGAVTEMVAGDLATETLLDLGLIFVGGAITTLLMQVFSGYKVKTALGERLPGDGVRSYMPKIAHSVGPAYGASAAIYLLCLVAVFAINKDQSPLWLQVVMQAIGLS